MSADWLWLITIFIMSWCNKTIIYCQMIVDIVIVKENVKQQKNQYEEVT